MKIAVYGGGLRALESLLFFDDIGAEVILFTKNNLGGYFRNDLSDAFPMPMEATFRELTSDLGRSLTSFPIEKLNHIPTIQEFQFQYVVPLINSIKENTHSNYQVVEACVLRVHKCFLSPKDNNEGRSRLEDLFRVVYEVKPDTNQDLSQLNISKEVTEALKESYEMYKDFDLVLDARGPFFSPLPMGPGDAFAINEGKFKNVNLPMYYGPTSFKYIKKTMRPIIIGSSFDAVFLLLSLQNELKGEKIEVQLVSNEKKIFEEFFNSPFSNNLKNSLAELLRVIDQNFMLRKENYEEDLFEWRSRPDYERVKYKEPELPKASLMIYENYVVCSVDKLYENNDLFLSIDKVTLGRKIKKDSKTLSGDSLFVAKGYKDYIEENEPGHFKFSVEYEGLKHPLVNTQIELEAFKTQIMRYFSPNKGEE